MLIICVICYMLIICVIYAYMNGLLQVVDGGFYFSFLLFKVKLFLKEKRKNMSHLRFFTC